MQTIAAKALAQTQFVPLMEAVLCVDCEMVSNSTHGHCPACGSRALMSIATALGGPLHGSSDIRGEAVGHALPARIVVLRKKKLGSRR